MAMNQKELDFALDVMEKGIIDVIDAVPGPNWMKICQTCGEFDYAWLIRNGHIEEVKDGAASDG